ncbi:copia protein [Trifolium pratense]|uniref:Copia protein n=1 Tax=Trifolium pratense TaxID=57577 RepID=A0A2K3LWI4_TRIPR|nr:copia protein [Trifolium pratense]
MNGIIEVVYCPTEEQLADGFTKAVKLDRFEYLRKQLNSTDVHNCDTLMERKLPLDGEIVVASCGVQLTCEVVLEPNVNDPLPAIS